MKAPAILIALKLLLLLASQVYAEWPHDSVCAVFCPPYGGSGCLVGVTKDGRGLVISAAHVFESGNRNNLSCKFPTVRERIRARILGFDWSHDLVALDIKAPDDIATPTCVKAASKDDGQITHVGYPCNAQGSQRYTVGPYIGYAGSGESAWGRSQLHTRCRVISGYSGGARFNKHGEYIGVISGMTGNGPDMDRAWGASGPALEKFVGRWMKCER
jgi:hypothetical protein